MIGTDNGTRVQNDFTNEGANIPLKLEAMRRQSPTTAGGKILKNLNESKEKLRCWTPTANAIATEAAPLRFTDKFKPLEQSLRRAPPRLDAHTKPTPRVGAFCRSCYIPAKDRESHLEAI